MSALRRDFPSRSIRFCVVIVSLFYNGERRGGSVDYYVQTLTRRSITCRKYLGQGSQGRFPRVQSYRVRLRGCRKFLEPIIVNRVIALRIYIYRLGIRLGIKRIFSYFILNYIYCQCTLYIVI